MLMSRIFRLVLVLLLAGSTWCVAQPKPLMLLQAAASNPPQSKAGLEGEWNGALDANGTKLRLLLKVSKDKDGKLTATIDSLDQNANGIPVTSVTYTGNDVKLELGGIAASFQGKMNADGTEISGDWKQGGGSLPLVFHRGQSKAENPEPKGLPASLAGFEDEASFFLIMNEERLATMKSSWKKDGSFNSSVDVSMAGQTVHASTKITAASDGRW